MEPVYIKRFIKTTDDLPKEYGIYLTEFGWLQFNGSKWIYPQRVNVTYTRGIEYWFEPKELPTEEELYAEADNYGKLVKENIGNNFQDYGVEENASLDFLRGTNWLLSKLK